jgi:[acyl-carrier-protein] S-malonyltransferase
MGDMPEKVAFLFAGQGSQYIGMGKDLYESFPESKAVFDKANEELGFDLRGLCFQGQEQMLKMTQICQPAVLTVSIACWEAFRAKNKTEPAFAAGLSLGEYSALVACGALAFADAVKLVRKRAELMEEAAMKYPGKMAAIIGLNKEEVNAVCLKAAGKVDIANLNSPGQTVISGEKEALDRAKKLALEKGAKMAVDLEVSGAFHSQLMWEAAMEFQRFLDRTPFNPPKIPVVSNPDALAKYKVVDIKESLVRQIYKPVLWEDSMRFILSQGVRNFIEFGPGKVLKGLMRRIDPAAEVVSIEKKEDIENAA